MKKINSPIYETENHFYCLIPEFFITNAFAQTSELKWQSSPIVIDGNEEDWDPTGGNLRFYDSKNQLFYDLRNDSVNLYILVKSDNPFLLH